MSLDFSGIELPGLTVNQKALFSETYENDPCLVSLLMNEFESDEKDCPFFSGLTPREFDKCDRHLLYKGIGSYLLNKYEKRGKWKHSDQRKVLEKAIRLFDKADKADHTDAEVALGKGKAYLYRSRIIRPKGFTIPGKKQETLKNALEFCKEAKEKQQPYADHFAGLVALEMDRCNMKPDDFEQLLKDAVNRIDDPFKAYSDHPKIIEFYQMRLRLEEVSKGLYDDPVLTKIFDFDKPGLELEKIKVAVCNPNVSDDLRTSCHIRLLDQLKYPFSHPLWEDSVRWLVRLHSKNESWQKFALDFWKAAEKVSRRTSSLHLRWYWSRQRDLYNLAFLAALEQDEKEMAAQIADSVKNRPALTLQALEKMSYDDEELEGIRKTETEQYARELGGGYQKDLTHYTPDAEIPSLYPELPETEAIIVQFYLVHLKGFESFERGYALIYDGKTGKWSVEDFDFKPIWNKYLQWQSTYLELPSGRREKSAEHLKALCLSLGEQLDFLFNLGEGREMVFVPHDFLHRVPIHGAMLDEKTVLLGNFNCMYLPTLSYANWKKEPLKSESPVLLQYFGPAENVTAAIFDDIVERFDQTRSIKEAKSSDITDVMPVSALAIRCHGEADIINPFFSKLKLKDNLRLMDIAGTDKKAFSGTRIFLGACETDLTPPLDTPLDEQLSMAAMFLNRGARAVIGTMWEAEDKHVRKLLGQVNTVFQNLGEHQKKWWKKYLKKLELDRLYDCLCFRIYYFSDSGKNGKK